MSKKTNGRIVAASAIALTSFALVACGGGSSETLTNVTPAPTPVVAARANAVTITVVDAKTGSLVTTAVKISLGGELGGKLTDANNATVKSFTTSAGVVTAYTDGTGTLEITASADGYMSGGTSVVISGGGAVATVSLTNAALPPATVAVVQQVAQTVAGKTAEEVTVASVSTDSAKASAELVIPAATTLKTASGVALSGPVTLSVASYDVAQPAAQEAMPGGFVVTSATGASLPLSVAAVANIEIKDAAGNLATTFDKPLTLRLDVPSSAINPNTGVAYAAGDSVDLLSYSSSVGQWKSEGISALKKDSSGLFANLTITHLTTFMVGQKMENQGCNQPLKFNLPRLGGINVNVRLANNGIGFASNFMTGGLESFNVEGTPVDQALDFSVSFDGKQISKNPSRKFACGEVVTIGDTLAVEFGTKTFNVQTVCDDGTGSPAASVGLAVSLFRNGKFASKGVTGSTGATTLDGLVAGTNYDYKLSFSATKTFEGTVSADNGNTTISIPVACPKLTGASRLTTGASGD